MIRRFYLSLLISALVSICLAAPTLADSDDTSGLLNISICFPGCVDVELVSGPPVPDANTVYQVVPWTFSVLDGSDTEMVTVMFGNTFGDFFNPDDPFAIERFANRQAYDAWFDAETSQTLWKETQIAGQDWVVPLSDPPVGVTESPEPSTLLTLGAGLLGLAFFIKRRTTSSTQ